MSTSLNELRRQTAPVICASCYLGGEIFDGDKVCPKTARELARFAASYFEEKAEGCPDDEEVELEVFGDTEEERAMITTTVQQVKAGIANGIDELNERAIECAMQVGSRVIEGANNLMPTETFTKVEITRLSAPTQ